MWASHFVFGFRVRHLGVLVIVAWSRGETWILWIRLWIHLFANSKLPSLQRQYGRLYGVIDWTCATQDACFIRRSGKCDPDRDRPDRDRSSDVYQHTAFGSTGTDGWWLTSCWWSIMFEHFKQKTPSLSYIDAVLAILAHHLLLDSAKYDHRALRTSDQVALGLVYAGCCCFLSILPAQAAWCHLFVCFLTNCCSLSLLLPVMTSLVRFWHVLWHELWVTLPRGSDVHPTLSMIECEALVCPLLLLASKYYKRHDRDWHQDELSLSEMRI